MAGLEGLLAGHTLVKRYTIEEVIGRGGFAVVYRATDERLGRPVAVKVITLTAANPEQREVLRQRLRREAQAAAGLPHHPNLVTVHDVGTDPELGLDFLVMEMLRGRNLAQALADEGRPPLDRALCILRDAAEGLAVGHRAGLIHRDVKPGNIFLAQGHDDDPDSFRVCLLDYGIAQAIEDDQTVTRGEGANPLSPAYASPEQIRGARDLTAATDVFSLGVVGYQLLTGERPFATAPGQVPTGWTVRTPIRELNPEVPPQVEQVVMKAMAVDPGERFPDADHFLQALEHASHPDFRTAVNSALAHIAVPPPELGLDEDDGTVIAPPPAALPDDEHTVIAPVSAHPRPPAHVSTRPRAVPPSAERPRRRFPVALVLALLLVAAAAWAVMSGRGGRADPAVGAAPAEAAETEPIAGAGDDVPPAGATAEPSAPLPRDGFGVGGDAPSAGTPGGTTPPAEGDPSAAAPPAGQPAVVTPSQPTVPQPQGPPAAQPQPPTAGQPQQPPSAQQPPAQQRPPAQQPPAQQRPPAQQPPARPPQEPEQPPAEEPRREPRLLGRPVEPRPSPPPDAPRDTIRIGNPGSVR